MRSCGEGETVYLGSTHGRRCLGLKGQRRKELRAMSWPEGLRGTERQGQDVGQWQEARDGMREVSREGRGFRGDAGKGATRGKRRKGRSRHQACPLGHSVLARGCSHHPSVASSFSPFVFIYLLTFVKFSFHPVPIAHVVLTPTTPPPSCPCSCLSVCLS